MENVSEAVKLEAITSLKSTLGKLENAYSRMTENGANTTLVKKRLRAVSIGLAMLESIWNQKHHHYIKEDLEEARNVIVGLFPSIESSYAKSKAGSPQRTLLERRITALKLAVQAIDDLSSV